MRETSGSNLEEDNKLTLTIFAISCRIALILRDHQKATMCLSDHIVKANRSRSPINSYSYIFLW